MYATRRRKRNVKSLCKSSLKDQPPLHPSNPSKRHRERLNSELELLASLLPFEDGVVSKLDKLSILRLAVSYLRIKSHFQAIANGGQSVIDCQLHRRLHHRIQHNQHLSYERFIADSEAVHQALSGFLIIITCDGEVFYASDNVEQYLGFHQSDVIHQCALEFIHSEDRDTFKSQLDWKHQLTTAADGAEASGEMTFDQIFQPGNSSLLQRCFTTRFRCLLDNASGFITLEVSGKIHKLLGQNSRDSKDPPLALFALCCPFGPLPLDDVPPQAYAFTSKHKMDMSPLSLDPRVQMMFGFSDQELVEKRGYDLIHPDDLTYFAAAHQELIKTGSSGLIAYRLMTKDQSWVWLQTSSRVIYKNAKPDHIICISRCLTEDEGKDLARKRGSEFKLPFPIIVGDQAEFCAMLEHDLGRSKSPRSKCNARAHGPETRKRKPETKCWPNAAFNANGSVGAGGGGYEFPAWDGSQVLKPALATTVTGGPFDAGSSYQTGYRTLRSSLASLGPTGASDDRQFDRYYLEPEACHPQPEMDGHASYYNSELLGPAVPGLGYVVSKASYDCLGGYGLSLSYRDQTTEEKIARYDTFDLRKHSYAPDILSPLTTGGLADGALVHPGYRYGVPGSINEGGLFAWHDGIYRSDFGLTSTGIDQSKRTSRKDDGSNPDSAFTRHTRGKENKTDGNTGATKTAGAAFDSSGSRLSGSDVISPPYFTSRVSTTGLASSYSVDGVSRMVKTTDEGYICDTSPSGERVNYSPVSSITRDGLSSAFSPVGGPKMDAMTKVNSYDRLVSQPGHDGNTSSGGIATSVIQLSSTTRPRNDEVSVSGGVAVPVLKSLGWPNNSPTYGWNAAGAASSYGYCTGQPRSQGETETCSPADHDDIVDSALMDVAPRKVNATKVVGFGESW